MQRDYVFVVLIIVGSVGNGLSFMLMMQKSVRSTPFGYYLAHVAVADTIYLYFGLVPAVVMKFGGVDIFTLHNLACKTGTFLRCSSGDFAIWLVLTVTVDRFIAVKYPFKAKTLCTLAKAKVVCVILLCLSCIFNSYIFVTRGLVYVNELSVSTCKVMSTYFFFERYIRPWYNIIGLMIIPGGSMIILNTIIIVTLWKHNKARQDLTNRHDATVSIQVLHTTITLLAVNMMFIILVCPCFLMITILSYITLSSKAFPYVLTICVVLININHSCNIFLYVLTSKQFRDTLMKWFCSCHIRHYMPDSSFRQVTHF